MVPLVIIRFTLKYEIKCIPLNDFKGRSREFDDIMLECACAVCLNNVRKKNW